MQLENGDLLLVSANGSTLSGAIDRVTQTDKSTHYSHIGLLEKEGKTIGFCMPVPERFRKSSFEYFLRDEQNDNNHVDVYRLRTAYRKSIPNAISVAKNGWEDHIIIVISFPMISYTVPTLFTEVLPEILFFS